MVKAERGTNSKAERYQKKELLTQTDKQMVGAERGTNSKAERYQKKELLRQTDRQTDGGDGERHKQ